MGALLGTRMGKVLHCLAGLSGRRKEESSWGSWRGAVCLDAYGVALWPLTHAWFISARALRKEFIISKYVEKKYAKRSPAAECPSLPEAVKGKEIFTLLQAYAENMDLSKPVQAHLQVWHLVEGKGLSWQ